MRRNIGVRKEYIIGHSIGVAPSVRTVNERSPDHIRNHKPKYGTGGTVALLEDGVYAYLKVVYLREDVLGVKGAGAVICA